MVPRDVSWHEMGLLFQVMYLRVDGNAHFISTFLQNDDSLRGVDSANVRICECANLRIILKDDFSSVFLDSLSLCQMCVWTVDVRTSLLCVYSEYTVNI